MLTDEEASVVGAIAGDPALAQRAKTIADLLLNRVERIVRNGTDAAVMTLAGRIMPALVKTIGDRGGDDNLRQIFEEMRTEMRTYGQPVDEGNPVAVEDEAPPIEEPPPPKKRAGGKAKPEKIRVSTKAVGGATR